MPAAVLAQPALKQELNLPRAGDKIVKQQVEYKDPGRAGENVVWDFGQLRRVNDKYKLAYSLPRAKRNNVFVLGRDTFPANEESQPELLIGREHFTNYFYQFKDSILFLLGYENRLDQMHYLLPLPLVKFPFRYGEKIETASKSENLFSGQVAMNMHGSFTLEADAYGMLVLPTGDTLKQVLRTHSVQTQFSDSIAAMDSIQVNSRIETHKFYARGYRYPVLETIRTIHTSIDTAQSLVNDIFSTAFIYLPEEQLYWQEDTANLAEVERMKAEEKMQKSNDPWAGMYYNVSPNPARINVLFEIYLPRSANSVLLKVSTLSGTVVISEDRGSLPEGLSSFTLNVGILSTGNYVLDFWLDGYRVHGGVVMKR
jgi:hypothetical protein